MKVQTLSLVIGTQACNAKCAFCVSHITGFGELPKTRVFHRDIDKAVDLALRGGATTALLTGKGEPTLYPAQISDALFHLKKFPLIELQTNGLTFGCFLTPQREGSRPVGALVRDLLPDWRRAGLTTIALSTSGYLPTWHPKHRDLVEKNEFHYGRCLDYESLVTHLRRLGFTIRFCIMAQKGGIDTVEKLEDQLAWCKSVGVEQVIIRPITTTRESHSKEAEYVRKQSVEDMFDDRNPHSFIRWANVVMTPILYLHDGGVVYSSQELGNLAIGNCLTNSIDKDSVRSLIFYPNGRLTYSWHEPGAVLLSGDMNE